jgi:hypothetical protein
MKQKVLKISVPGFSTNATLDQYIDFDLMAKLNWSIQINSGEGEADVWFVLEDVPAYDDRAIVAPENVFYGSAETALPLGYLAESRYQQAFLRQFRHIYTHHDLYWENAHSELPFLGWMINSNHGPTIVSNHHRDHKFLSANHVIEKKESPLMSVFCSNQSMTPGHRLRFRFVEELKKYFGENLEWFGNGVKSIPEKWDGLAPYRYTIVLENHPAYNVITEKLYDAFLAKCFPIYWGAPNVDDYFSSKGFMKINIEDLRDAKKRISSLIESDVDREPGVLAAIEHNRRLVLNEYNSVSRLLRIADRFFNASAQRTLMELNPRNSFLSGAERLQNAMIQKGHRAISLLKRFPG